MILHWLGPMFDPALEGYWGSSDLDAATDTFLEVIAAHPDKVDGIKVSLLDAQREVDLRRRLPKGVRCYTGDDFNYPELIAGDEKGFSHALLGIFDPLGPAGGRGGTRCWTPGTRPASANSSTPRSSCPATSSRRRPASTRPAWCSWPGSRATSRHFTMVGGLQSARSLPHFARAYELADGLGLFPDPKLAQERDEEPAEPVRSDPVSTAISPASASTR